eukprot:917051-Rhodomonas_salina.1
MCLKEKGAIAIHCKAGLGMPLRARYAMSGTRILHWVMAFAMSGTRTAYGSIPLRNVRYGAMRYRGGTDMVCLVLRNAPVGRTGTLIALWLMRKYHFTGKAPTALLYGAVVGCYA